MFRLKLNLPPITLSMPSGFSTVENSSNGGGGKKGETEKSRTATAAAAATQDRYES